jgi:hypothetical protein
MPPQTFFFAGRCVVAAALPLGAMAGPGCKHASPGAEGEGKSSYAFIYKPAPPGPTVGTPSLGAPQARDVVVQAEPILPLAKPVYPKAALTARDGASLVGVRISVDSDGRVSDVRPSLVCLSTPGPFAGEFQAAVEAALALWRFEPGEVQHLEPANAPDGSQYMRVKDREKVEWTFDVSFTFTAAGDVLSGLPGRAK